MIKRLYIFKIFLFPLVVFAQDNLGDIQTESLSRNLHIISGAGGNIAVLDGEDGVFVIDNGMPFFLSKVVDSINNINPEPVRIVFNTHWHFDHSGGNDFFGRNGTLIVAQDNVRKRMSSKSFSRLTNSETKPSPYSALPLMTFDKEATFHINGETVSAMHMSPAHTDGDSVLSFQNANVVHMGDLFFNGLYPVIDVTAGGSIRGMIEAIEQILPTINDSTRLIPGHGPVGNIDDLRTFKLMLVTVEEKILKLIEEGKTVEEVIAAKPSKNFDESWSWSFMPPDRWVSIVYDSIVFPEKALASDLSGN